MKTIKSIQLLLQRSTFHVASVYASCASYYWMLSILPALMFFLTVFSKFSVLLPTIPRVLEGIVPQTFLGLIDSLFRTASHMPAVQMFSASAILWLWSASKGLSLLREGMNAVLRTNRRTSFIRRRLTAIGHFCLLTVGFTAIIFFTMFGKSLLHIVSRWIPGLSDFLLTVLEHRLLYTFLLLTFTFAWVFRLQPNSNISLSNCCIGGALTAIGWLVLSYGFTFYVTHFADKFHLWGDLGTLLLAAIWLRLCALLILFGIKYADLRSKGYSSALQYFIFLLRNIHE